MARITVEDCIDKFSSRFELVLVASQRARKLHSGEEPTIERDNDKNTVIALREIADSTISKEEIKENLIQEYQTISISDEEQENQELQAPIEKDELNEDTEEMSKENLVTKTEVEQEMSQKRPRRPKSHPRNDPRPIGRRGHPGGPGNRPGRPPGAHEPPRSPRSRRENQPRRSSSAESAC